MFNKDTEAAISAAIRVAIMKQRSGIGSNFAHLMESMGLDPDDPKVQREWSNNLQEIGKHFPDDSDQRDIAHALAERAKEQVESPEQITARIANRVGAATKEQRDLDKRLAAIQGDKDRYNYRPGGKTDLDIADAKVRATIKKHVSKHGETEKFIQRTAAHAEKQRWTPEQMEQNLRASSAYESSIEGMAQRVADAAAGVTHETIGSEFNRITEK